MTGAESAGGGIVGGLWCDCRIDDDFVPAAVEWNAGISQCGASAGEPALFEGSIDSHFFADQQRIGSSIANLAVGDAAVKLGSAAGVANNAAPSACD